MKTLHMKCVFVITGIIIVSADVSVVRIKPDPQQLPCSRQMIEYQCQILVPTATLIWSLHTGEMLEFGVLRSVGDVRSSSDNVYSATLTGKREDDDSSSDRFFFTSTLLIREPVNQTTLTCTGVGGVDPVDKSTTITQSGIPDPPYDLSYNSGVVIESSVDLRWTRPSYTGGVAVVNYTVSSTSGGTVTVKDSSEDVQYSPGLVYGDVMVSAINTCGLESQPAAINIPAAEPPRPNILVEFTCESLPWTIEWTYEMEEGVVYPNMNFILNLTPTDETASSHTLSSGDPACSDATSNSTYCTVNVSRDVYIISVNLTNDLGSTINSNKFDTRAVIVENEILEVGERLSLTVTVNTACTVRCLVVVSFGTQPVSNGNCKFQKNVTSKQPLSPGDTTTLSVEAGSVTIQSGEIYCYLVTLCGNKVICGTSSKNPSTAITASCSSDDNGLSVDAVAGISVTLTLLVVLPVGVVFGCCGMWCLMKSRGGKKRRMAPPLYEEPVKPFFSLTENKAYGQVAHRQTTS